MSLHLYVKHVYITIIYALHVYEVWIYTHSECKDASKINYFQHFKEDSVFEGQFQIGM